MAADYTLALVRPGEDASHLIVRFAAPLPREQSVTCALPSRPCPWSVEVFKGEEGPLAVSVTGAMAEPGQPFGSRHLITLELATPIPSEFARVVVTLLLGNAPTQSLTPRSAKAKRCLVPVDKAEDASLYFSGIVAPGAGVTPVYTIDARANWRVHCFGDTCGTPLAISATAKTDKRNQVDPDSFSAFLSLQHYASDPIFKWDAGVESNREANVLNVVSAARAVKTLRKTFRRRTVDAGGNQSFAVRTTIGINLGVGVELGANLRNAYDAGRDEGAGSGLILRGVPSARVYIVVPAPVIRRLVLKVDYQVRFLAKDELFLETRNLAPKADPVPHRDRRSRHYVQGSAKLMMTDWVALQFGYEHGSLPPAFKFVNHSGTIGFVFQARQSLGASR
jgi:hypothetical protein